MTKYQNSAERQLALQNLAGLRVERVNLLPDYGVRFSWRSFHDELAFRSFANGNLAACDLVDFVFVARRQPFRAASRAARFFDCRSVRHREGRRGCWTTNEHALAYEFGRHANRSKLVPQRSEAKVADKQRRRERRQRVVCFAFVARFGGVVRRARIRKGTLGVTSLEDGNVGFCIDVNDARHERDIVILDLAKHSS